MTKQYRTHKKIVARKPVPKRIMVKVKKNSTPKEKGYVYIFTNPSFKDDWIKIGITNNIEKRLKSLDKTALPLPFEPYASMRCSSYERAKKVETMIHRHIEEFAPERRIRKNREFFNITPEQALQEFKEIADLMHCKLKVYNNSASAHQIEKKSNHIVKSQPSSHSDVTKRRKSSPFRFSMIGLKKGDTISFAPSKINVKVENDRFIKYQNKLFSLSRFCNVYMPDKMKNPSGSYRGPDYFVYQGKTLNELRKAAEKRK